MLPAPVAADLIETIQRFLAGSFGVSTAGFRRADGRSMIDAFLAESANVFKGPYLSLGLPFRKAAADAPVPFRHLVPEYTPYRHQLLAFERLCAERPLPTLVATGTGSGKTECFMWPLLDACVSYPGLGIKAIIIYPMNALATDQAGRFARLIHEHDELRSKVTVGLFTGDSDHSPHTRMSATQVVTDKETMRKSPPDILLTNYKMLDYLLLRPKDQALWQHNALGVLRYLVVDELHTFDGAQGTDLACLIRRLRGRLAGSEPLACVGTSATVGEQTEPLLAYASSVFGTTFGEDAVIREDRLSVEEFLRDVPQQSGHWPSTPEELKSLARPVEGDLHDYVRRVARAWFPDWNTLAIYGEQAWKTAMVELGQRLLGHAAFRELLRALEAQPVLDMRRLEADWLRRLNLRGDERHAGLLDSLVSLVSAARAWRDAEAAEARLAHPDGKAPDAGALAQSPFLTVRTQLWLRELRRMVASVSPEPVLTHADDVPDLSDPLHLPVVSCRECQMNAWVTVIDPQTGQASSDLRLIYDRYFSQHADVRLLIPDAEIEPTEQAYICPACEHISSRSNDGCCSQCGADGVVSVRMPDTTTRTSRQGVRSVKRSEHCPSCGAPFGLFILGFRAVSLASSLVGRLMHTPLNTDHKLIAFSDSVQDAAHRAGFLTARTYGRVVRTALREFLMHNGGEMSLGDMVEAIGPYSRERQGDDARFCGLFMPANLMWWNDYTHLTTHGRLPPGSDLAQQIGDRLGWEALTQFGAGSQRGTSLERTGVAVAGPDVKAVEHVLASLQSALSEEAPELVLPDGVRLRHWLLGLLQRMRLRGSISHASTSAYLSYGGKPFPLKRSHPYLPYFAYRGGPVLLTVERKVANFDCASDERGWYVQWFSKCFGAWDALASSYLAQAHRLALTALRKAGLVDEYQLNGTAVWALNPGLLRCSSSVATLNCDSCGVGQRMPAGAKPHWEGAYCTQVHCHGHLHDQGRPGFQGDRYQGEPFRVRAAEHTALVPKEQRDRIEQSFRSGDAPWDVSVLSASPTLEMGVDIGDLSSVLLCSMPPGQANYLQRVGRAGRRDGNALAVTIAGGRPHDLYFYADPLAMMAGEIDAPGVFLKAGAVLERQLLAFAMDRWVHLAGSDAVLPARLKLVLDAVEAGEEGTLAFPFNWFIWLKLNSVMILERFFTLFPELDSDMQAYLTAFLKGGDGQVTWSQHKVIERLRKLADQRKTSRRRIEQLKRELARLEAGPRDETVDEQLQQIGAEKDALSRLMNNLNRQQTLNFFTDEGLLPNYAFPEEGVTLNSVILKRSRSIESTGDERHRQIETLSYQRAASAALSEFAPENWFYASGRKVRIEQIDLVASPIEQWRYCDRCHHAAPVEGSESYSACPRCGSVMWKDASQARPTVHLRQVMANSRDDESLIGDDSEQREPVFYARQLLVDVPPGTAQSAYRIADEALPFAFEYLPSVTLRDVNFGHSGATETLTEIGGVQTARPGFRICRHCGKLDARWLRFQHAWTCPVQTGKKTAEEEDFVHVDLLRELKSEAVRILLPLVEVGESTTAKHSLVAAIQLGLKLYFRGKVDHLQIQTYADQSSGVPRQYLLIYDTVPGGTGYLKELLSDPEVLLGTLKQALGVLRSCACVADEHADGCYRCIYAYRNSRDRASISRRRAEELLGRILDARDKLETIDTVANVNVNSLLESELEARFIAEFQEMGPRFKLQTAIVANRTGYELLVDADADADIARLWEIVPQFELGEAQGVRRATVADFLIRPVGHDARPVLVYLDGFSVHVDQVADDAARRLALRDADNWWVFTLAWKDLPSHGAAVGLGAEVLLLDGGSAQQFDRQVADIPGAGYGYANQWIKKGPFAWLVDYLSSPAETQDTLVMVAASRVRGWLDRDTLQAEHPKRQALSYELRENAPAHVAQKFLASSVVSGGLMNCFQGNGSPVEMIVGLNPKQLKDGLSEGEAHICLDDRDASHTEEFETVWRGFWAAVNLLQFVRGCTWATRRGVQNGSFDELGFPLPDPNEKGAVLDSAWDEVRELCDDWPMIEPLAESGAPAPVVGYEHVAADHSIVAELELAWPDRAFGIVLAGEATPAIEGWEVISFGDADWFGRACEILIKE